MIITKILLLHHDEFPTTEQRGQSTLYPRTTESFHLLPVEIQPSLYLHHVILLSLAVRGLSSVSPRSDKSLGRVLHRTST